MPPSRSAEIGARRAAGRRPGGPAHPQLGEGHVAVGVVLTSFGLKGDIKVEPLSDFPERFEPGQELWLAGQKRRVQRSRWQGGFVYVKLSGIATPEAVAALRGQYLEVPEAERAELPPGEFYRSDIEGLTVVASSGETLGTVTELLATGANDVLVVHGKRGEVLVPMIEDVIQEVDLERRRIMIELIDGLLPEPRAERPPRTPRPRRRRT